MGNDNSKYKDMVGQFNDLHIDEETRQIINQQNHIPGSRPPLLFHSIHGTNVTIMRNGRVAKRKESFCKGLAFSNRPIEIDESVCLRLSEVATNWSGVLRFGVTNFDPETYRNQQVPKFACPDLTTKDGYWAKALPERYSVQGNILHFYVNNSGELFYGINGSQKGMFLTGINTNLPVWLIVDIYGNSVGLEIIDASEFQPRRNAPPPPQPITTSRSINIVPPSSSSSDTPSNSSRLPAELTGISPLHFHSVTGRHITLNAIKNVASRDQAEYSQGYVFTERPIQNNEKVVIMINTVQRLYEGGIAFGLTCCDPATLRTTELPEDSSDLVDMPQYWVGIKDIALQPRAKTILSFWITDSGDVKFQADENAARTVLVVDNSLELYMYFDVYGSTLSIKMLGCMPISRSYPSAREMSLTPSRNEVPLSIPRRPARPNEPSTPIPPYRSPSTHSAPLRVNVRAESSDSTASLGAVGTSSALTIDDLLGSIQVPTAAPPIPRRVPPIAVRIPSRPPPSYDPPAVPVAARPVRTFEHQDEGSSETSAENECTVCMDATINAVLYTCGHMCMCYECARRLVDDAKGICPICRAVVQDVIKCFKA